MATVERSVLRIDRPEVQQGMTLHHRVRPLMPAAMRGDFAARVVDHCAPCCMRAVHCMRRSSRAALLS